MVDRRLAYVDRFVFELEQSVVSDIDETTPVAEFPDQTTQTVLITSWSQEEYTRILSALLVGATLAYPYQDQQIFYDFLKVTNAMIVDCDDVADCIETSAAVAQALLDLLAANGFTPAPESAPVSPSESLTDEQSSGSLLPDDMDCTNHAQNMAVSRAIVRELNESVEDAFEALELATNATEALGIVVGAVPVAGAGAAAIEMANWIQDTVRETYEAAYNQSAEDTIACAIYCHIEAECEISLDSLLAIYEDLATITVPEINTFEDLIAFVTSVTFNADVTGVALFQYFLLRALKFGGVVFDLAGFNDLSNVIKTAATYSDFSYTDCDDCPVTETPTTYWRIFADMVNGPGGFVISPQETPPWGTFAGDGFLSANISGTSRLRVAMLDFGATYDIYGAGLIVQGRGFAGTGSDVINHAFWTGANLSGTVNIFFTTSGVIINTNDQPYGSIATSGAMAGRRSYRLEVQNPGADVYPTNFSKVWRIAIVGHVGPANAKPPQAHYWKNDLTGITLAQMLDPAF